VYARIRGTAARNDVPARGFLLQNRIGGT
jgi:hypothetical protein